ncbi:MAG: hypothetical protein ACM3US_16480 [Sphingomonadaceae bacterium]
MTADEDQGRHGRNPLTLPLRFLLHGLIKTVVLIFLGIRFVLRRRAVRYALLLLVALGAIAWNSLGTFTKGTPASALQPSAQPGGLTSVTASNQLPPSPVVEQYLQAQASFDGRAMWDLISDEMKDSMQPGESSIQQLQAELDTARRQGRRYLGATYVGGVPLSQGGSVYFYVLSVDGPGGSSEVPYIYVVGPDGKIVSIQ